jgi:hypothetical protein
MVYHNRHVLTSFGVILKHANGTMELGNYVVRTEDCEGHDCHGLELCCAEATSHMERRVCSSRLHKTSQSQGLTVSAVQLMVSLLRATDIIGPRTVPTTP